MKRKILVGNWKMNKTIAETIDFVSKVNNKALEVANNFLNGRKIMEKQWVIRRKNLKNSGRSSLPML